MLDRVYGVANEVYKRIKDADKLGNIKMGRRDFLALLAAAGLAACAGKTPQPSSTTLYTTTTTPTPEKTTTPSESEVTEGIVEYGECVVKYRPGVKNPGIYNLPAYVIDGKTQVFVTFKGEIPPSEITGGRMVPWFLDKEKYESLIRKGEMLYRSPLMDISKLERLPENKEELKEVGVIHEEYIVRPFDLIADEEHANWCRAYPEGKGYCSRLNYQLKKIIGCEPKIDEFWVKPTKNFLEKGGLRFNRVLIIHDPVCFDRYIKEHPNDRTWFVPNHVMLEYDQLTTYIGIVPIARMIKRNENLEHDRHLGYWLVALGNEDGEIYHTALIESGYVDTPIPYRWIDDYNEKIFQKFFEMAKKQKR